MKRLVLIAALTACVDAGRSTAPEATRVAATPPIAPGAAAVPAVIAERFPDAASIGTGERAVWIVTNEAGALLAWGRGPAAAETETTTLINLSFRRRRGPPPSPELTPEQKLGLRTKSRGADSPSFQPQGRTLHQPTEWLGDARRMLSPDLKGLTLSRYRASRRPGALVTVVTVVIGAD